MQADHRFSKQLEKIDKKLLYINDALNFNLSQDQKEWIQAQYTTFTKLAETLKSLDKTPGNTEHISEDIYKNLRRIKNKIISWLKFTRTDVEASKLVKQQKGQGWLAIVDHFPCPEKLSEIRDNDLWDIDFPCLAYTNQELCQISERILKEQNILSELNISPEKLSLLIEKISCGYNTPLYHNFSHGFNVFQTLFFFLKRTESQLSLDKIEKFACLLGALGHDLNHKGYNNAYEVKVRSENSILYCDDAPLENMHASTLVQIFKDSEINFYEWFADAKERMQFQELATAVILATDMSRHNRELQKFTREVNATLEYQKRKAENEADNIDIGGHVLLMDRASDKKKILKLAVHASDFTATCQKYDNYMYWVGLLAEEFDYQTKKEEKKGIEVSVFLKYTSTKNLFAGQISFAKNLSLPLWEQLAALFGGVQDVVQRINDNLKRLEEDKEKAEEK